MEIWPNAVHHSPLLLLFSLFKARKLALQESHGKALFQLSSSSCKCDFDDLSGVEGKYGSQLPESKRKINQRNAFLSEFSESSLKIRFGARITKPFHHVPHSPICWVFQSLIFHANKTEKRTEKLVKEAEQRFAVHWTRFSRNKQTSEFASALQNGAKKKLLFRQKKCVRSCSVMQWHSKALLFVSLI